jgi:hypothetical protein
MIVLSTNTPAKMLTIVLKSTAQFESVGSKVPLYRYLRTPGSGDTYNSLWNSGWVILGHDFLYEYAYARGDMHWFKPMELTIHVIRKIGPFIDESG